MSNDKLINFFVLNSFSNIDRIKPKDNKFENGIIFLIKGKECNDNNKKSIIDKEYTKNDNAYKYKTIKENNELEFYIIGYIYVTINIKEYTIHYFDKNEEINLGNYAKKGEQTDTNEDIIINITEITKKGQNNNIDDNKKTEYYNIEYNTLYKLSNETSITLNEDHLLLIINTFISGNINFSMLHKFNLELYLANNTKITINKINDIIKNINDNINKIKNKTYTNAKNIIINGTPGCGKSYFVNNYVLKSILGDDEKNKELRYSRITFTEGLTYEDFFGCYKPVVENMVQGDKEKKIIYKFVPGPFIALLIESLKNKSMNYVLIIEELNRGRVYEIFRGIFQLLDRDNEGKSAYPIEIPEDAKKLFENNKMYLPSNFYIICTMNNADSRVEFLDTAFKRRFCYGYMNEEGLLYCSDNIPGYNEYINTINDKNHKNFIKLLNNKKIDSESYHNLRKFINEKIINNQISEDKLISKYFITNSNDISVIDFVVKICGFLLQNVLRNDIRLTNAIFGENYITIPNIFSKLQNLLNNNNSKNETNAIENGNQTNLLNLLTEILKNKIIHEIHNS